MPNLHIPRANKNEAFCEIGIVIQCARGEKRTASLQEKSNQPSGEHSVQLKREQNVGASGKKWQNADLLYVI